MRYLNKVVFVNSATIRYSEVQLGGNVHLTGTQGIGKSTIFHAILFFYDVDTQRFGISVEKKPYQDYYLPYAGSSITYEVAREDGWFTVLSYKIMNRICHRFIASPYRPDLFIDRERTLYPSDHIRSMLDRNGIKYDGAISMYREYRNILYGNSDNKRDYSCYSLMESDSYQNVIRTIQNVLLNSRLETGYIKQTIITSLSEADNIIDSNRHRSHLSGFEAQLDDIGVFRESGMTWKAVGVSTLSDDIRERGLWINDLCRQLRGAYLETERILPELSRKIHKQEAVESDLYKQRDKPDVGPRNRTAAVEDGLTVLRNALPETEAKRILYTGKDIQTVMDRCNKLEISQQEQESLVVEKDLLSSKNRGTSVLYANLIANLKSELTGFENEKQKQLLAAKAEINVRREARQEYYRRLREELCHVASEEKERLLMDREKRTIEVAILKMCIETIRGQSGTSEELEAVRRRLDNYDVNQKDLELKIRELKYELNYQTKESETAGKHLGGNY